MKLAIAQFLVQKTNRPKEFKKTPVDFEPQCSQKCYIGNQRIE